ncbi:type I-E CRISPR-associated protein Cse1/CasA [Brachybacterium sp. JHP9]|uniref:Type I-E CRISPR-associated protein Cse1/CasA n=1 Tax=Brachybacterium equifaecis TaxID=2910770 RepID=A0ABT0R5G1_9MICO|nr:type I-E CRISPR-associated protein Cse1/CasA [Brachybacterium equifaecis]MCL6424489.1 type I-E CRISPR-associated protein Cse1/CasA [Brachybacterium equifaecis]
MTETPSFSLITERWIRCQAADGTDTQLSLREIFDGSVSVAAIRGDSPTQDYAVLRILLAIFWRAHRSETEVRPGETFDFDTWREFAWEDAVEGGADDAALDYLDRYAARFDLLHPEAPFMQVADLATPSGSRSEIQRIVPEAESSYFSMRAGNALDSLALDEAARWLIHTQAYDYSGIKSGAIGDPRVKGGKGYPIGPGWSGLTGGTTILGSTLRETFVLNTAPAALTAGGEDRPVWEREPDGAAQRLSSRPTGPSDFATWQSRRVRLFVDHGRVTSVLVSNGDQIPEAGANVFGDPMTPYRFSTNKSKKNLDVYYPRPYSTERMMWRSLEPLIALGGETELQRGAKPGKRPQTLDALAAAQTAGTSIPAVLSVRLTSASYGAQASSASTTVDSRLEIPRALLHEDSLRARTLVLAAARAAMDAAVNLGSFAGQLQLAAGGEYVFQPAVTDALLAELEPSFREWLGRFVLADAEAECTRWQQYVHRAVRERAQLLLRGAGTKALIGREILQNDRPVLISAGSAYGKLLRDLRKSLPLLRDTPSRRDDAPASGAQPADTSEESRHDQ